MSFFSGPQTHMSEGHKDLKDLNWFCWQCQRPQSFFSRRENWSNSTNIYPATTKQKSVPAKKGTRFAYLAKTTPVRRLPFFRILFKHSKTQYNLPLTRNVCYHFFSVICSLCLNKSLGIWSEHSTYDFIH